MRWKRHQAEEIVAKLDEAARLLDAGLNTADVARALGITDATYFRWKRNFAGLRLDQVSRLKQLELENARLRRAIAEFEAGAMASQAR
jgi:transposase-like protein